MAIPPFDPATGLLPRGEHEATWAAICEMFGWNDQRRRLLQGLASGLTLLAGAGCTRAWVDSSFVTATDEPSAFTCVWSTDGVDRRALQGRHHRLFPIDTTRAAHLFDFRYHRATQKEQYGGDFLPNVTDPGSGKSLVDFFRTDRDEHQKGVVVLNPAAEAWQ